jgi:hypothetical protein
MPRKYTRRRGGGGVSGRPKSVTHIQARPFTMVAPQGGTPRDAALLHAQQANAQQACANNPANCGKSGGNGGVKGRNTTFTYPTFPTSGPPQALNASDTSKAAATTGAATTVQSSDDHYATQPIPPKTQSGGRRRGRKGGKRSRRAGRSVKWGCSSGGTRRACCRRKNSRRRHYRARKGRRGSAGMGHRMPCRRRSKRC